MVPALHSAVIAIAWAALAAAAPAPGSDRAALNPIGPGWGGQRGRGAGGGAVRGRNGNLTHPEPPVRRILKAYGRVKGKASGVDYAKKGFNAAQKEFIAKTALSVTDDCIFFTKECVKPGEHHVVASWWTLGRHQGKLRDPATRKRAPRLYKEFTEEDVEALPSVEQRSWGRCAFVAYGSNLLRTPRGEEIDKHDTVIRIGLVNLDKYAKAAGRRITMTYVRHRKLRATKGRFAGVDRNGHNIKRMGGENELKYVLLGNFERQDASSGYKILTFGGDLSEPVEKVMGRLLTNFMPKADVDATSGMVLPLHLVYSKFCSEVGIFGVSMDGGKRYWDERKGRPVASNHNTGLESHIWLAIQELGDKMATPVKYYQ